MFHYREKLLIFFNMKIKIKSTVISIKEKYNLIKKSKSKICCFDPNHNKTFESKKKEKKKKKKNTAIEYSLYFYGTCKIFQWNPNIEIIEPYHNKLVFKPKKGKKKKKRKNTTMKHAFFLHGTCLIFT